MKAIVYTKYGPPEVLQLKEIAKPVPKDNEVLINIIATTVNRTDCGFRKPEYPVIIRLVNGIFKPKKKILGSELAGVIEATGKDVKTFKAGDHIFGLSTVNFGAHAEYMCMPETGSITTKPANYSFNEAAAVCDGLMLAFTYVSKIDFKNERKILINGASGSIGSACVQLAKYYGAEITAVTNTNNFEIVRSLGADILIDYAKEDFTQNGIVYDVIIDAVGKSSFFKCKRILKPGGVYFSTELGYLAQNVFLALATPILGILPGMQVKKVKFPVPSASKKDIIFFKKIIESGNYKAIIDRTYPLEKIAEATRYVETGQKVGNVVITLT